MEDGPTAEEGRHGQQRVERQGTCTWVDSSGKGEWEGGGEGRGGDDTCSSRINNMGYKVGRMINEFRQEFRRKKRSWSKPEFLFSHGDLRPKKSTPI